MKLSLSMTQMILFLIFSGFLGSAVAPAPWYINTQSTVTTPMDVGDVIVYGNRSLTVQNVPDPGFKVSGHMIVTDDGKMELKNSVIKIHME